MLQQKKVHCRAKKLKQNYSLEGNVGCWRKPPQAIKIRRRNSRYHSLWNIDVCKYFRILYLGYYDDRF